MRFTTPFLVMLLLIAACARDVPDDRESVAGTVNDTSLDVLQPSEIEGDIEIQSLDSTPAIDPNSQCDAEDYLPLVGQTAAGTQFPVGPDLRVYGVNDIITQELMPQRTNIVVDDTGVIQRVYCG